MMQPTLATNIMHIQNKLYIDAPRYLDELLLRGHGNLYTLQPCMWHTTLVEISIINI